MNPITGIEFITDHNRRMLVTCGTRIFIVTILATAWSFFSVYCAPLEIVKHMSDNCWKIKATTARHNVRTVKRAPID